MRNYKKYSEDHTESINDSIEETDSNEENSSNPMGKVIPSRLYIRQGPGTNYDPITDIPEGSDVLIVSGHDDESTDWYEVITASGQEGFVMKEFIELND